MNEYYNLNYSEQEIDFILRKIKEYINENNFIISQNKKREENIRFIKEYNLTVSRQKKLLLSIVTKEFCHSLQNTNIGFEYETLYVFCPQRTLFDAFGEEALVEIYIKFNIIEYENNKQVVTISFHKRNKPVDYLFR